MAPLPQDENRLSEEDRRKGQRSVILFNLFGPVINVIILGDLFQLFASDVLGMRPTRISWILGFIPLLLFLRFFLLDWVRRFGRTKLLEYSSLLRLFLAVVLLLLPVSWMSFRVLAVILVVYSLSKRLGVGTVFQPLIREVTTEKDRGRFLSRMGFAVKTVQAGLLIVISWFVGEHMTEFSYRALLFFAVLALLNTAYWARKIPDVDGRKPGSNPAKRIGFRRILKVVRKSPLMRIPLVVVGLLQVCSMPMMVVYFREVLVIPADLVAVYLLMVTVGASVSFLIWGRIADAIGFQPMLKGLLVLNILIAPLFLLVAPFDREVGLMVGPVDVTHAITWLVLIFLGLAGGALSSGIGIVTTTIQHYHVRSKDSLEAMNAFQVSLGLLTAGILFLSGYLIEEIAIPAGVSSFLGGFVHMDWVKVFLVLVFPLILVGVFVLTRKLPNTKPSFVMDDFFASLLNNPFRTLIAQRNRYRADERVRIDLARWLGQRDNPLANDSLIELTRDPSYDVRVEAIRSLGLSRSAEAGEILLDIIRDDMNQHLIDHVAWALGELRYAEAIPVLVERLSTAYPVRVRAMAARSLGEIGHRSTIEPIVDALLDPDITQHIRSSCVRALIALDAQDHAPLMFSSFDSLENRYESFELMAAFCEWMAVSGEWLLRKKPDQSMGDVFVAYFTEPIRILRGRSRALVSVVRDRDLAEMRRLYVTRTPGPGGELEKVFAFLNLHLNGLSHWTPSALLAVSVLNAEE